MGGGGGGGGGEELKEGRNTVDILLCPVTTSPISTSALNKYSC